MQERFDGIDSEQLAVLAREGEVMMVAREVLIERYDGKVKSIAWRYANENWEDVAQEGRIGLLEAVEVFDIERGFKFWTVAVWYVKKNMIEWLSQNSKSMRLPHSAYWKLKRLSDTYQLIMQTEERSPSREEVEECAGTRYDVKLDAVSGGTVQTSLPLGENGGATVGDMIEGHVEDPLEGAERRIVKELVSDMMKTLSAEDAQIIKARFGIGYEDERVRWQTEVAKECGLSSRGIVDSRVKRILGGLHEEIQDLLDWKFETAREEAV